MKMHGISSDVKFILVHIFNLSHNIYFDAKNLMSSATQKLR
jgi:hypothetical protein